MNGPFKIYCTSNDLLNFEGFFELYQDFNLFPDLIQLTELKSLFYFLSKIYKDGINGNKLILFPIST